MFGKKLIPDYVLMLETSLQKVDREIRRLKKDVEKSAKIITSSSSTKEFSENISNHDYHHYSNNKSSRVTELIIAELKNLEKALIKTKNQQKAQEAQIVQQAIEKWEYVFNPLKNLPKNLFEEIVQFRRLTDKVDSENIQETPKYEEIQEAQKQIQKSVYALSNIIPQIEQLRNETLILVESIKAQETTTQTTKTTSTANKEFTVTDISHKIPTKYKEFFKKIEEGYYDGAFGSKKEEFDELSRYDKDIEAVFNYISDGESDNPKNLIHSIGGYTYREKLREKFLRSRNGEKEYLMPLNIERTKQDRDGGAKGHIYFSTGGTVNFMSPLKELCIFSIKNPTFRKFLIIEMTLLAKAWSINIPEEYTKTTKHILENTDRIIELVLANEEIQSGLTDYRYRSVLNRKWEWGKWAKNRPESGEWYYGQDTYGASYAGLWSLGTLTGKTLVTDDTQGIYFPMDFEAFGMLAEYLGKPHLTFMDLANMIIDLPAGKMYQRK